MTECLRTSYDPNCEYVDGVLFPKSMPTSDHSTVQGTLLALLRAQFPRYWVGAELGVQVRPGKFLVPDLAVQDRQKMQRPDPTDPIVLVSKSFRPDDSLNKTVAKCEVYHEWGTVNTWIIDPQTRRAWQYLKGSSTEEVDDTGRTTRRTDSPSRRRHLLGFDGLTEAQLQVVNQIRHMFEPHRQPQ